MIGLHIYCRDYVVQVEPVSLIIGEFTARKELDHIITSWVWPLHFKILAICTYVILSRRHVPPINVHWTFKKKSSNSPVTGEFAS